MINRKGNKLSMTYENYQLLEANDIALRRDLNSLRYSKKKHGFLMYQDMDLLENIHYANYYIRFKYKLQPRELYLLLKIYPMGVFSQSEFAKLPRPINLARLWPLVENGYVEEFVNPKIHHKDKDIFYTTTHKTKQILKHYYGLLSGEVEFPEAWIDEHNQKDYNNYETRLASLAKELSELTDQSHKEVYYSDEEE